MARKYERLKDVMAATEVNHLSATKKSRAITDDQARLMSKIGTSQADVNDKARAVLRLYLELVLEADRISDDQAEAALSIMGHATTSGHRQLCNQVLSKYLSQFEVPAPAPKREPVAA